MEPDRRFERHPDARWRQSVRGVLVTGPRVNEPALLVSPGDAVWAALAEPRDLDGLVAELAEDFEGSRDTIAADVTALLDRLVADGLVRYCSQP